MSSFSRNSISFSIDFIALSTSTSFGKLDNSTSLEIFLIFLNIKYLFKNDILFSASDISNAVPYFFWLYLLALISCFIFSNKYWKEPILCCKLIDFNSSPVNSTNP